MPPFWLPILIFTAVVSISCIFCFEGEMTVNVEPGREDCFYQTVQAGESVDFDYQVIDGGHGDLDINFHAYHPTGRVLVTDYKKSENNHRFEAKEAGDYRFCFDNKFSTYNVKTVFFELLVEKDDDSADDWTTSDEDVGKLQGILPEDTAAKLQDVTDTIARVRAHLVKARHVQDMLKSFEARDRNVAEENFYTVNTFSFIQAVVMVAVGIVQVIMVKSLFDDSSKIYKIIRKLDGRS